MKNLFIIGNWKSNMALHEAIEWLRFMKEHKDELAQLGNKKIIICPPFTLLFTFYSYVKEYALPIAVGAQDISPFDSGAFTGEVNGKQIKEFADYVIIGHSERRTKFDENEALLGKKVEMAKKYQLTPIYCVPNKRIHPPNGLHLVAYEPLDAISTSGAKPVSPEEANMVAEKFSAEYQTAYPLYGGSVIPENVQAYSAMDHIYGFLVGGASLDPRTFLSLIQHA